MTVARPSKQMPLVKKSKREQERNMSPTCRWCDKPATDVRDVIPADINARTKEIRRAAVTADACAEHAAMVDREYRCRELEGDIHKIDLKLRRTHPGEDKHANLTLKRANLRRQLLKLQGRAAP